MTAAHTHSSLDTLTSGALFHHYKLLEKIGIGGQGVVWSALDQQNKQIFAIKFSEFPDTSEAQADNIRDEQQLGNLAKLHHANILPLHEYGFDQGLRYTISPYLPGGTLAEKIKTTPLLPDDILRLATEIASALDYLHSQEIIHRDLKTSNILLDLNQKVYLADFGLARLVTTSTLAFHTGHGTPPYAPPEQIQMKAITSRSDVFSFGIMLYEMFTGQLPWSGKKQLGLEQTHSKQEIPDPWEFNEELPEKLVDMLRQITSADPQLRPKTAGIAMKMLYYIFDSSPDDLAAGSSKDNKADVNNETEILLSHGLERWYATNGSYNLGLTKFTLIDLDHNLIDLKMYSRFMLSQALTYGYNDDKWWSIVDNPRERLSVSLELLLKRNEGITGRIIGHLINDKEIRLFPREMTEDMTASLLEIGTTSDNLFLRQQIFDGVRIMTQPGEAWNDVSLNTDQMKRLGIQALEDSEVGDMAAGLIGHLRSESAVQIILDQVDEERKYSTLLLIQQSAGNLPSFMDGKVRFRLTLEWIMLRLLQQPVRLIGAYVAAFLGASLGIGVQIYLTYRLPTFFDTARITASLEQGLIIGTVFGLGIFLSRVIVERFQASRVLPRLVLGTISGGLIMNIALFIFHVLFLNTLPLGLLITAGCMLVALSFSVGGLLKSRVLKVILATASIFGVIIGTWLIHVNSAATSLDLTPIFKYDYDWTLPEISSVAIGVAIFMGTLGNLIDLSTLDE